MPLTQGNVYFDQIHTAVKADKKFILHQNDGACTGVDKVLADMDTNGDKVISEGENKHKINVAGYSWGAVTGKIATDKIWAARKASKKNPVKVCSYSVECPIVVNVLVTIDVVTIGNGINGKKTSLRWANYFQSKRGKYTLFDSNDPKWRFSGGTLLSRSLRGKSMRNADVNIDATKDEAKKSKYLPGSSRIYTSGAYVNHDIVTGFFKKEAISELNK